MNEVIAHFSAHHDHFLYAVAGVCLFVELSILGLSGPLLFVAFGCVATGLLVSLTGNHSWELELLLVSVLAVLSAIILWKPLKNLQNSGGGPDTSSDMIGKSLLVTCTITRDQGRVAYSGIEWQARLDAALTGPVAVGDRVIVAGVDGSLLLVKPR